MNKGSRLADLLCNPAITYALTDTVARCVEAKAKARAEAIRAQADVIRRLIDLSIGTALGAMGMAFALVFGGG